MTLYKVWLTGQSEPEVVRADTVREADGLLVFANVHTKQDDVFIRAFQRPTWHRWCVVQDDADLVHL